MSAAGSLRAAWFDEAWIAVLLKIKKEVFVMKKIVALALALCMMAALLYAAAPIALGCFFCMIIPGRRSAACWI